MIRLQRVGRKNDPSFRVVVTDSKNGPRSGKFLEIVGSYDARKDGGSLDTDRIKHWIAQGAGVSATVHNLLVSKGVISGKKINVLPRKSPPKVEGAEAAPAPAAETPAPAEKTEA